MAATSPWQAGVATVDITPPVGYLLAGYANRKAPSTGVHTPLNAKVLLLDDGSTRAAVVMLDLIWSPGWLTQAIRAALSARVGVPAEHIMVSATHTHGGPEVREEGPYGELVVEQVAGAAAMAAERLQPTSLGIEVEEVDFAVNRRLLDSAGVAHMRPNPGGV